MAERLRSLGHEVVCLSPPGFGAPVPDGFGATRLDSAAWLTAELEKFAAPVHLVGHDWGGGHVLAVATGRPDLIRSWCVDVAGIVHPDYVWHDMAQVWQTPDAGEAMLTEWRNAPPEARSGLFTSIGMDAADADEIARAIDADMARCILALYRSAAQPAMATFGTTIDKAKARLGLVIIAAEDTYVGTPQMAQDVAAKAGATVVHLDGVGHWWMVQQPERAAETLATFINSVN
jgi:pimeloyl-ACP methyl ester carboxylesterase